MFLKARAGLMVELSRQPLPLARRRPSQARRLQRTPARMDLNYARRADPVSRSVLWSVSVAALLVFELISSLTLANKGLVVILGVRYWRRRQVVARHEKSRT